MAVKLAGALLSGSAHWKEIRAIAAYRRAQEILRARGGDVALLQYKEASRQLGCSEQFVIQAVAKWFEESSLPAVAGAAFTDAREFFIWARTQGLRLGVVSDYQAHAKLSVLGLDAAFDAVVCAQDPSVGVFKPDPKGLLCAVQMLGVAPEECLYIGDREETDVAAARSAGVQSILIDRRFRDVHWGKCLRDWRAVKRHVESLLTEKSRL
jgi:HAD superfamily hydrolase (TIGR01549 family)